MCTSVFINAAHGSTKPCHPCGAITNSPVFERDRLYCIRHHLLPVALSAPAEMLWSLPCRFRLPDMLQPLVASCMVFIALSLTYSIFIKDGIQIVEHLVSRCYILELQHSLWICARAHKHIVDMRVNACLCACVCLYIYT